MSLRSVGRRKVTTLLRLVKHDWTKIPAALVRVETFVVYRMDTPFVTARTALPPAITVRKLADRDFADLSGARTELQQQLAYFLRRPRNDAYGLFVGDTLAHISWLISTANDRLYPIRNVRLRVGEAEITHCITLSDFRGRGLYPLCIRFLCQLASDSGVRTVFMITSPRNVPSIRGMEKAGLHYSGRILRVLSPQLSYERSLTLRGHRMPFLKWQRHVGQARASVSR